MESVLNCKNMIKLTYKISINSKEILQDLYVGKNEVLINIGNKEYIYFKELNQYFVINQEEKTLSVFDNSKVISQIDQVRKIVGEVQKNVIENEEFLGYKSRIVSFNNTSTTIKFKSKIKTIFMAFYVAYPLP